MRNNPSLCFKLHTPSVGFEPQAQAQAQAPSPCSQRSLNTHQNLPNLFVDDFFQRHQTTKGVAMVSKVISWQKNVFNLLNSFTKIFQTSDRIDAHFCVGARTN